MALCVQEIGSALEAMRSAGATGHGRPPPGFASAAEAQATFQQARMLVARLEGKISAQCDPQRWPEGNTQPAAFALGLLAELQIHDDTIDILMCAPRLWTHDVNLLRYMRAALLCRRALAVL